MASAVPLAYAMGVANKEAAHVLLLAKGDHLAGSLVPQRTNLPPFAGAHLLTGTLQLPPASRPRLAAFPFPGELTQRHLVPPFEGADPPAGNHECGTRVGGDGGLVDLSQVDGGLHRSRSCWCRGCWHGDMQLIAVLPDQLAAPEVLWQIQLEHERCSPPSHRQHDAPAFHTHRLRRPEQWIKALVLGGIPDVAIGGAQFAGRLNVGEEAW